MNKTELIEAVAKEANLSKKDAGAAVAAVFGEMTKALKKGDKVLCYQISDEEFVVFGKVE